MRSLANLESSNKNLEKAKVKNKGVVEVSGCGLHVWVWFTSAIGRGSTEELQ